MMTSLNKNIFRITGNLCREFPPHRSQRPVTQSFDVFFDLRLNKCFGKQWWGWWFEITSCPLWRHCNGADTDLAANHQWGPLVFNFAGNAQHIYPWYEFGNDKFDIRTVSPMGEWYSWWWISSMIDICRRIKDSGTTLNVGPHNSVNSSLYQL